MGMMMLPPAMISLPFKLLLFVLVDGWHLITASLMGSFRDVIDARARSRVTGSGIGRRHRRAARVATVPRLVTPVATRAHTQGRV